MGSRDKLCTCAQCGWVHFVMTRSEAKRAVESFNGYFASLSKKDQKNYYGGRKVSMSDYESCWCGSKEFRETKKGDCPPGVTIGPIIWSKK